jgi:hypothetical protein
VRGLAVTITPMVAADPQRPGRVVAASSDWGVLVSSDGARTVRGADIAPYVFDVAIDAATGATSAAGGSPTANRLGEIWTTADAQANAVWVAEGLGRAAGGVRPVGVAVGRDAGGARVLLAGTDGSGVWRKVGAGAWTRLSVAAMAERQTTGRAVLAWPAGGTLVYLYDRHTGVWRSRDAGRTWAMLWRRPSPVVRTGHLAVAAATPSRLWVSTRDGLYRLDNAATGSVSAGTVTPRTVAGQPRPGPIAIAPDGAVWATGRAVRGVPPGIWRSADAGATWADMSDAAYRGAAAFPRDVAFDGATPLVALEGTGLLIGEPAP